ncbi:hypothetical protein ACFJIY_04175 [Pimelobacter simplex]
MPRCRSAVHLDRHHVSLGVVFAAYGVITLVRPRRSTVDDGAQLPRI